MVCVNKQQQYPNKDADALKKKVILEFKQLLKKLGKGYKCDYEFILEKISLIELYDEQTEFVKQFYLNNTWQTQF